VSLVVTPEDYAELSRREKQFHTERERSERMLLAARVLAGLMVLLASVVGLVRLKEWTRCTRAARTVRVNKDGAKVKALVVACVVILAIVVGFLFLGFSTEFPPPPH